VETFERELNGVQQRALLRYFEQLHGFASYEATYYDGVLYAVVDHSYEAPGTAGARAKFFRNFLAVCQERHLDPSDPKVPLALLYDAALDITLDIVHEADGGE
jgi:hypothetical protein